MLQVNLTKVSIQISVFEPRSFLERIIDGWVRDWVQAAPSYMHCVLHTMSCRAVIRACYAVGFREGV